MEARSIYEYIWFGTCLRYLQDAVEGTDLRGDGLILWNIDAFVGYLERFKLNVTRRAADAELAPFRAFLETTPEDYSLTDNDARELRRITGDVRKTLEAEAEGAVAYILRDKRYDVNKLLVNVPALLDDGVFAWLPEIARHDLAEAGRCIAMEAPTAAAFHLLRGTESALRQFYCAVVRRGRVVLMWGPMVTSLRARQRRRPPEALLDHLDNIRRSFRNPTQHPEKTYDIEEAQNLFGLCADVLSRMRRFIEDGD